MPGSGAVNPHAAAAEGEGLAGGKLVEMGGVVAEGVGNCVGEGVGRTGGASEVVAFGMAATLGMGVGVVDVHADPISTAAAPNTTNRERRECEM